MSSTPHTHTSRWTALFAATAAASATVVAIALPGAAAQTPTARTLTFHELDKGATFVHVRNTPTKARQSNLLGDAIVFTNPVTDASGAPVGRLHASCVTTTGANDFRKSLYTCTAVLHLRDGDLFGQFIAEASASSTAGAVTGGTGAYANARGTIVSTQGDHGSDDTITLTA
jgi:Dirigent-like protein